MVWGLFPVDPLPGEEKYYFFSTGTYKVGRKGCDIIINKDKGVSRIHAEVIIDEMISPDRSAKKSSNKPSKVRIRDCSKYGTFVNKSLGSQEKIHELPNKETMLKDGDLVSFGTGTATYRFCFVPFMFVLLSSKPSEASQLQKNISLIGGCVSQKLNSQCTHVLVDDFLPVNFEILDAIAAKKPLARCDWVELLSGKRICNEIPSPFLYAPTLTLESVSVRIVDPPSREHCLRGYTFLLESIDKYKFKDQLQLLLDVADAKVLFLEAVDEDSQSLEGGNGHVVRVIPHGTRGSSTKLQNINSLPSIKEMELISAILTGTLDTSILMASPVVIDSSCSTDETVVADSDLEMETASSIRISDAYTLMEARETKSKRTVEVHKVESAEEDYRVGSAIHIIESTEHDNTVDSEVKIVEHEYQGFIPSNRSADDTDTVNIIKSLGSNDSMERKQKAHESESGNLDIIYSQDLIVRNYNRPYSGISSTNQALVNFKAFRKMGAPSGNSFNNLIPFAKNPYEESDYGNEDIAKSVKEEKKRKQMEAIAEDLFNNEKGKRRAVAGGLRGLFAHG